MLLVWVIGLIENEIERDLEQRAAESEQCEAAAARVFEGSFETAECGNTVERCENDFESVSEEVGEQPEEQESTDISDDFDGECEESENPDEDEDLDESEDQDESMGMSMGM